MYMGNFENKTVIITGGGRPRPLSDGTPGSIGPRIKPYVLM
jgi:hypothetical protein